MRALAVQQVIVILNLVVIILIALAVVFVILILLVVLSARGARSGSGAVRDSCAAPAPRTAPPSHGVERHTATVRRAAGGRAGRAVRRVRQSGARLGGAAAHESNSSRYLRFGSMSKRPER